MDTQNQVRSHFTLLIWHFWEENVHTVDKNSALGLGGGQLKK
jgi:hypothetical protein